MKIYELRHENGEKEWIAAHTVIEAIKTYSYTMSTSIAEFSNGDEIVEVPEADWDKMIVKNLDYDKNDPDDWEEHTFREEVAAWSKPQVFAGTNWDQ
jgi:hypothetical protein